MIYPDAYYTAPGSYVHEPDFARCYGAYWREALWPSAFMAAGGLLLVPQFTLAADTRKGNRPGFSTAAPPERAERLFLRFCELARAAHGRVETGRFGADMQVALVNVGPVTFWLQTGGSS